MTTVGELLRDSVVVWDVEEGSKLYAEGFYGKPLGVPKPRELKLDAPLVLDLVEALYLMRLGRLRVMWEGREMSEEEFMRHAETLDENFRDKYRVYNDLRERGFVVLPGIKFGCDFAAYRHGPGLDHAPFIIQVKGVKGRISALEIIRSGRLATSVRKHFTISVPQNESNVYVMFEWWRA